MFKIALGRSHSGAGARWIALIPVRMGMMMLTSRRWAALGVCEVAQDGLVRRAVRGVINQGFILVRIH